ncbi:hypothetical protein N7475_009791 [Penicillium sp. IBT 31633x]|nr:hypothetical protein N7475_009791 [Penicillium sp. IBT 31633x]
MEDNNTTANLPVPFWTLTLDSKAPRLTTDSESLKFDSRHLSLDGSGDSLRSPRSVQGPCIKTNYRNGNDGPSQRPAQRRSLEDESLRQQDPSSIQIPRTLPIFPPRSPQHAPSPINRPYRGLREPPPQLTIGPLIRNIVPHAVVDEYRRTGAQYQSWISGRSRVECPIQQSSITWSDLVDSPNEEDRFNVCIDDFRSPPEKAGKLNSDALPIGRVWRFVYLKQYGCSGGHHQSEWNIYMQSTGPGAIFTENIARSFGPYWSQIAQAQYQRDRHIDTLRYVYFIDVQNQHTSPYVETRLYPRFGLAWEDDILAQEWEYATREYQELLGTKLGRAVARLVLGAWPKGTHRIDKIVTWTLFGLLQMRFDIVPI